jgi:REP element-mobilizing transposase RayT
LDAPGVLHHVIIRGIERRKIFRDDRDRDALLERLSELLAATRTACYAWALLPNHAHFLFRTGQAGLSTLMRRLLTGYAVEFNRRHRRHGQLFQNRYKSIICQEDIYLKELVRYIHLNPLRAKIVSDLSLLNYYAYGGHSTIMGKRDHPWQDTEYVLAYFGRKVAQARRGYLGYVEDGIAQGRRPELVGGGLIRSLGGWAEVKKQRPGSGQRIKGDERILGESDFVTAVLAEVNEKYDHRYKLKRLGYDLKKIEQIVTGLYQIEAEDLYSRNRQKTLAEARSLLCYWAVRELGISGTDLAKRLGMTQPGIVYAIRRGERLAKEKNYQLVH